MGPRAKLAGLGGQASAGAQWAVYQNQTGGLVYVLWFIFVGPVSCMELLLLLWLTHLGNKTVRSMNSATPGPLEVNALANFSSW